MDNKKSYVYKITCKITGEYYFGSSFYIMRNSYWGKGRKIKDRIAKYGKDNFVKEILGEFDDRTIAHRVENLYIEQFRHDDKCLNKRLDHHFVLYGEESRAKIGAANAISNRGKIFSEDHRLKLSVAQREKHLSEEHKAKIGVAQRGKHLSEEHRSKISAAKLGKHWCKNPVTGKREWYD